MLYERNDVIPKCDILLKSHILERVEFTISDSSFDLRS
jgi:hypothetical protein